MNPYLGTDYRWWDGIDFVRVLVQASDYKPQIKILHIEQQH